MLFWSSRGVFRYRASRTGDEISAGANPCTPAPSALTSCLALGSSYRLSISRNAFRSGGSTWNLHSTWSDPRACTARANNDTTSWPFQPPISAHRYVRASGVGWTHPFAQEPPRGGGNRRARAESGKHPAVGRHVLAVDVKALAHPELGKLHGLECLFQRSVQFRVRERNRVMPLPVLLPLP